MRMSRYTATPVNAVKTAAVIFAAAFTALAATPALAGTYTFNPCGTLDGASWSLSYPSDNAWVPTSRCPYELEFKVVRPSNYGNETLWSFPSEYFSGQTIDAVQFTIGGNNGSAFGVRQGVRVCGPSACGPLIYPSEGSTGPEAKSLSVPTGEIPPGANQLQLYGACELTTHCFQLGPGFVLDDIEITFRDETAPELILSDSPPEPSYFRALVPNGWNAGTKEIWFRMTDSGSGGQFMRANSHWLLDDVSVCDIQPTAIFTSFCPTESGVSTYSFPMFRFPAGDNMVRLAAYDASGNVSPEISIPFKVDNVRPPPPSGLVAAGATTAGWNSSRSVRLQWVNTSQIEETATESGISAARYDISPGEDGQTDPAISPFYYGNAINSIDPVTFPADGIWRFTVSTYDRAGNISNSSAQIFVRIDSLKLAAPVIESLPWVGGGRSSSVTTVNWSRPANAAASKSGICGYATAVDTQSDGDPGAAINVYGDVGSMMLPNLPAEHSYLHLRAVSCAGVPGAVAHLSIDVDLDPPIVSTNAPAAGTWLDENGSLRIDAHDDGSGVAQIDYSVDGDPTRTTSSASVEVPLAEGKHVVSYSVSDVAGNATPVRTLAISVDRSAPVGAIDPLDPIRPTLVRAVVTDTLSGIAKAWLEYQALTPGAETAWHAFGPVLLPGFDSDRTATIETRFPDAAVPAGAYRIRIVAYDRAGHLLASDLRLDGMVALLTTPLRATPSLIAGFRVGRSANAATCKKSKRAKSCHSGSPGSPGRLSQRRYVAYGSGVTLEGALSDDRGNPLSDASLDVYSVGEDRARRPLGQVVTGADGAYRFLVPAGPSRQVIVRFGGSEVLTACETTARVLTYGKVTLKAPKAVNSGRVTVLRGRVLGAAADISARGVPVEIQYKAKRSWLPLRSTQSAADGRYSVKYAFARYRTPLRFKLRALVRKTSDSWPYETGNSTSVTVTVTP